MMMLLLSAVYFFITENIILKEAKYQKHKIMYTFNSNLGKAVNYTLRIEGISNDYIMLYVSHVQWNNKTKTLNNSIVNIYFDYSLFVSGDPTFHMSDPSQLYGRIALKTTLTVEDTDITPLASYNISKDSDVIITNDRETNTSGKYRAFVRKGDIKFEIFNTDVTDEATYTYNSSLGNAASYTLRVEGRVNEYTMILALFHFIVPNENSR